MIQLHFSHRTESLMRAFAEQLQAQRRRSSSLLTPVRVVVPNQNMERYIEFWLAQATGVAANLKFQRLERFVAEWVTTNCRGVRVLDRGMLESLILWCFLDPTFMNKAAMKPVVRYLDAGGDAVDNADLRRVQLSAKVASLFEEYTFSRPEMLDGWDNGATSGAKGPYAEVETWQRALWNQVRQLATGLAPSESWLTLGEAARLASAGTGLVGETIHVVGVSYVARVFQEIFGHIGRHADLHIYTLNPAGPGRETVDDNFLLSWWGRPGHEYVALLSTLGDGKPEFHDDTPAPSTLLRRLQQDVVGNVQPDPAPDFATDTSLQVFRAASPRREIEAIAEEIWHLVRADQPDGRRLRFNDIAVLINASQRDQYLPHISSVFEEAQRIPHNTVDVPLAADSRVVEAALMLLDLPLSRFTRPELLALLTHPALRCPDDEADRGEWVDLCERLGIFHGAEHADHDGTYITRDIINWDQGVRRVVLGAFMTGEASGDPRMYAVGEEQYPVEENGHAARGAARFALMVRSLTADARFAAASRFPLKTWAEFLAHVLETYLAPRNETEEADLRRCMSAVHRLTRWDLHGSPVSYRVAAELARDALSGLSGVRGDYLADGVVVSSMMPMRAMPFRVIFVVGLAEGTFPSTGRQDTLDLRTAVRKRGDVSPTERDQYMFLETLLCARDRLYLSYVSRDPQTGDPLGPSTVVHQLLHLVEQRHHPRIRETAVRTFPLRRYDPPHSAPASLPDAIPEAHREAHARACGEAIRQSLGRGDALERLDDARALLGGQWPQVQELLGLSDLPDVQTARQDRTRVSLYAIRRFLECSLQGWASRVLGLDEDGDAVEAIEDEPFDTRALEATMALRDAFLTGLAEPGVEHDVYERLADRYERKGLWPTGLLRDLERDGHHAVLENWTEMLAKRARGRELGTPTRIRFGSAPETASASEVRDSIVVPLADGRKVAITGATEPLLADLGWTLTLSVTRGEDPNAMREERRDRQFQHALRGFVSLMALVASGEWDPGQHTSVILKGGGPTGVDWTVSFDAITPDEARTWLHHVVQDMFTGVHGHLLPCEAVFLWARAGLLPDPRQVLKNLDAMRGRDELGSSRYGPVPRVTRYPNPTEDVLAEVLPRRFGLFMQRVRVGGAA